MKTKLLLTSLFIIAFVFITNAQITLLRSFNNADGTGQHPMGDLISDGTFLYGIISYSTRGVVFKIKPDGTTYDTVLNFTGPNGSSPVGSLIYDGTFLYGMTAGGGAYNDGTLFKIKPNGTGYFKILDFAGTANGKNPTGSLFYDGTFLYGMTTFGGINDTSGPIKGDGTIFKIKPDGTGYSKLLDFADAVNGKWPHGGFISDGTFLYGMTSYGGVNDYGTLFKIKTDGTGYAKYIDFAGVSNGANPYGSLIADGAFLYGQTFTGGTFGGVIFKIKPDGTGFAKIVDFGPFANGGQPNGSLISDGIFLYGTARNGGTHDSTSAGDGVIFKVNMDGTGYTKLVDFAGISNGANPYGSLFSDGSFFYGTTAYGGANNDGTIFKLGITTGIAENTNKTSFTIYPNPTTGIFDIRFSALTKNASIEIYNSTGALVYNKQIANSETAIELAKQPAGIYFVRVMSDDRIIGMQKIVKQ